MDVFYYILGICLLEEEINIMIDIIIPVYNAERFLKRCVDSIFNADKSDLEFDLG